MTYEDLPKYRKIDDNYRPKEERTNLYERVEEDFSGHEKIMSENSNASPAITNVMPAGVGDNYGGMGALAGILPIALLAPLLGLNRGAGVGEGAINLAELGAVRRDVGDAKSDLRESIGRVSENFLNRAFEAEKAGIESKFTAQIETLKAVNNLDNKIDRTREILERMIDNIGTKLSDNFTKLSLDQANATIGALKEQVSSMNANASTNAIVSALKAVTCSAVTDCGCGGVVVPAVKVK